MSIVRNRYAPRSAGDQIYDQLLRESYRDPVAQDDPSRSCSAALTRPGFSRVFSATVALMRMKFVMCSLILLTN